MTGRALAVIIAAFFSVFTAFAVRYSYGMLLPEMLPSLEISKTEAGVIFSSYFIAYTIVSPIIGLLADRYNVRVIVTLFAAALGVGTLLMSFSSSVVNASLFFIITGIGHSALWVPFIAIIQRWVSDSRRGTALAFADVGSASGIIVWSVVIPLIVSGYGWRVGWLSLGISGLLLAVVNFILVRDPPSGITTTLQPASGQPTREPIKKTYAKLMRNSTFWVLGISYMLVGAAIIIPFTFLSTYAVQGLHLPYGTATRLITTIAVVAIAGKLLFGPISDRLGRIKITMLCVALITIGTLGIAISEGIFPVFMFTAVFGLGYGAVWALYAAAASDYFPRELTGSIVGLWTLYLGVGSIAAPVISGWTIDTAGTFTWAFVISTGCALVSLLLLLPVMRISKAR